MSPLEAPSWKLYLELRNNFIKFLKNILISYLNTILTRTLKDLVRFLHKDSYKNFQRSCKILVWIFVRSCCGLVLSYKNLTRSCKILVRFWWELFEENDIKGNICKRSCKILGRILEESSKTLNYPPLKRPYSTKCTQSYQWPKFFLT